MIPKCELFLARDWDAAWRDTVRPWLAAACASAGLRRDHVLVPTRGQAHALKLRCVREGVPLLGIEFLTPGLARKKWTALQPGAAPALGRELLLFGLRAIIERRLQAAAAVTDTGAPSAERGVLRSLRSDPERALDDFDGLLRGGFAAEDFPEATVSSVFGELAGWARGLGHELAAVQAGRTAFAVRPPGAPRAGDRTLVYGFGAEARGEFFNLAAFVRCGGDVCAVLPGPEFAATKCDEDWVTRWEEFLGVEAVVLSDDTASNRGAAVADLWLDRAAAAGSEGARVLVGATRADEADLLADTVAELLRAGAENMAVVFPPTGAAHAALARRLAARGIAFADQIGAVGTPPVEARIQRALLDFQEHGGRLEELLALWALLRPLNLVPVPLGEARAVCERLFDEGQTHALAAYATRLGAGGSEAVRAVAALAERLLPWPAELTVADALARLVAAGAAFAPGTPPNWAALERFAADEPRAFPRRLVVALLRSFLPADAPAASAPGTVFARVTLTTRRRAEGVAWSHVIFAGANAEGWPRRPEPSPWLPDAAAAELNRRGRFSPGVFTTDDRAALERAGYASLARNARDGVVFTAALHDDEDSESRLAPNRWVERILVAEAGDRTQEEGWSMEQAWLRRVAVAPARSSPGPSPSDGGAHWREIWLGRRDPARPFDEHCYAVDPAVVRPARLAARLIERGVGDPVELWFDAVLGVKPVAWEPLARARKKAVGQLVHGLLAAALRVPAVEGVFAQVPPADECRAALAAALAAWRAGRPRDRYWDSFHAELAHTAAALLEKVLARGAGRFAVVEFALPHGLCVPVPGVAGAELCVSGRIDLVLADAPRWDGGAVEVVDFKTGADQSLSAKRMAERGDALQLGLYLAAVRALGAPDGCVWLVKPDTGDDSALAMGGLDAALAPLAHIWTHLTTGRYGQLTPDRGEFTRGRTLPLACTPVPERVLRAKFALTFGEVFAGQKPERVSAASGILNQAMGREPGRD